MKNPPLSRHKPQRQWLVYFIVIFLGYGLASWLAPARAATSAHIGDASVHGGLKSRVDEDKKHNNDQIFIASAPQGGEVGFEVIVSNKGHRKEKFNIDIPVDNFPSTTRFSLFDANSKRPLTDTNGDHIADTGWLAKGKSMRVLVVAHLPSFASGSDNGKSFEMEVTARSTRDGGSDSTIAKLGFIASQRTQLSLESQLSFSIANGK